MIEVLAFLAFLMALAATILAWFVLRRLGEVAVAINGRLSELLTISIKVAEANGVTKGRAEVRAEQEVIRKETS
jgi:hypothetical protein